MGGRDNSAQKQVSANTQSFFVTAKEKQEWKADSNRQHADGIQGWTAVCADGRPVLHARFVFVTMPGAERQVDIRVCEQRSIKCMPVGV